VSKELGRPFDEVLKTFQRNLSRQHRDRLHYCHLQGTKVAIKNSAEELFDIDLKNLKVGRLGQI
jgi:hypothetical protein